MTLNYKFGLILILIFLSCNQIQNVSDVILRPSARDVFERDLKDDVSIYNRYLNLYSRAQLNNLQLELPSAISSFSDTVNSRILAYTIALERGQRFKIESPIHPDSLQLSFDLFAYKNDSVLTKIPIGSNKPKINALQFDVVSSGTYKIVILPNRNTIRHFLLRLYTEPTLAFPVSGKANKDIQSFWGATRSGGNRSHKGIDIFAKRGTPVVSATNGYISSTGNRGLGGKQVWIRDGVFGHSLYYAHLDSIAVSGNNRVKIGDTLGFVGNTGNARTTSPHLHFGIYDGQGAIDPLPFVKKTTPFSIEKLFLFSRGQTRLKINELRVGADKRNKKITNLEFETFVDVIGKTKQWFHLRVHDSLEGFMHESLLKEM